MAAGTTTTREPVLPETGSESDDRGVKSVTDDATRTGTITRLLGDLEKGDRAALGVLFAIVYDELRSVAHQQRRNWNGDATMDTTALVHEAYLKLVDVERLSARTRVHFLRVAAMAMRQILCNYARHRRASKRGGSSTPVSLDGPGDRAAQVSFSDDQVETLSDLDEALRRLQSVDARLAAVVECRFFGGLTIEDTAQALEISAATVKRDWCLARSWLFREMRST